jgi:hypothetical protein
MHRRDAGEPDIRLEVTILDFYLRGRASYRRVIRTRVQNFKVFCAKISCFYRFGISLLELSLLGHGIVIRPPGFVIFGHRQPRTRNPTIAAIARFGSSLLRKWLWDDQKEKVCRMRGEKALLNDFAE